MCFHYLQNFCPLILWTCVLINLMYYSLEALDISYLEIISTDGKYITPEFQWMSARCVWPGLSLAWIHWTRSCQVRNGSVCFTQFWHSSLQFLEFLGSTRNILSHCDLIFSPEVIILCVLLQGHALLYMFASKKEIRLVNDICR